MEGLVTLLEANRPTVETADGIRYLCYLKGRIKRDVGRIMVGDRVLFEATDPGEGRIEGVLARTNQLIRPPVANVEGLFVIFSVAEPRASLELLDKRLVVARLMGLQVELVLSKVDLVDQESSLALIENAYRKAGYPVWRVATPLAQGIGAIVSKVRRGIWVMTGDSGVGKSTLLNAIVPSQRAQTQELSRIGRGQQTTRWVHLYRLKGYWLADSPGYTALDVSMPSVRHIESAFPEFSSFTCRFADCLHGQEPGCEVIKARDRNELAAWRYDHYRKLVSQWVKTY